MSNPQKNPLVKTLNTWWDRQGEGFQKLLSKSVPATVVSVEANRSIVTVNVEVNGFTFPKVRAPVGTPEWIRLPIQPGDKGVLLSADFYMGEMSGIGGGRADLTQMSNLSNGIWFPIGNTSFDDSDANIVTILGPDGVALSNKDRDNSLLLGGPKGGVTIDAPLGGNILRANWTEATSDADAKGKGVPFDGVYKDPSGGLKWQRIPD